MNKGNIFLLAAALVWGFGLVSQRMGMEYLGPFGFTAVRCVLGGISMIPLVKYIEKKEKSKGIVRPSEMETLKGAFVCGVFLALVIICQQIGIQYTSVGKAGFITALYILITPVSGLFLGKKVAGNTWFAVVVALIGMYFLCLTEGIDGMNFGDIIMIGAAFSCAAQMHAVDYYVSKLEVVKLSCYMFLVVGAICFAPAIVLEGDNLNLNNIIDGIMPILYSGLVSCAGGYTLQNIGQKYTEPTTASLLLSSETVFTLFAGWLMLGEILKTQEYIGCIIMFAAMIIAQLPSKNKEKL
ncbi:MAG: DMT family transporter [Firmicutes bacterium]|nr:DMT family transporter [Bacillota bacterium]